MEEYPGIETVRISGVALLSIFQGLRSESGHAPEDVQMVPHAIGLSTRLDPSVCQNKKTHGYHDFLALFRSKDFERYGAGGDDRDRYIPQRRNVLF